MKKKHNGFTKQGHRAAHIELRVYLIGGSVTQLNMVCLQDCYGEHKLYGNATLLTLGCIDSQVCTR